MGKIVLEKSDYVIFTMDDPRNEDPNEIIDDLISSGKTLIETCKVISKDKNIKRIYCLIMTKTKRR